MLLKIIILYFDIIFNDSTDCIKSPNSVIPSEARLFSNCVSVANNLIVDFQRKFYIRRF